MNHFLRKPIIFINTFISHRFIKSFINKNIQTSDLTEETLQQFNPKFVKIPNFGFDSEVKEISSK